MGILYIRCNTDELQMIGHVPFKRQYGDENSFGSTAARGMKLCSMRSIVLHLKLK